MKTKRNQGTNEWIFHSRIHLDHRYQAVARSLMLTRLVSFWARSNFSCSRSKSDWAFSRACWVFSCCSWYLPAEACKGKREKSEGGGRTATTKCEGRRLTGISLYSHYYVRTYYHTNVSNAETEKIKGKKGSANEYICTYTGRYKYYNPIKLLLWKSPCFCCVF